MLELFRAGGPEARGPRRVLAISLSAAGHAGILALALWLPRPGPSTEAPAIVTVSLHFMVVEPAPEKEADGAAESLAGSAGAESPPDVEERAPPSPPRIEPRHPPPTPLPEREASEPAEPAVRTILSVPAPVAPSLAISAQPESVAPIPEPEAAEVAVDGADPPSPAAGLEDGEGTGGEPASAGGLGSGRGGGDGEGRGGRRGKGRGSKKEADVLPELVHAPKPPYPARSRDLGEEGTVIIAILVGEDGKVRDSRVATSSDHPLLDGSALATVRKKWRFRPGRTAGEPVARWVRVPVEFRIRKR